MKKLTSLLLLAFASMAVLAALGCERKPVAVVNGEAITHEELEVAMKERRMDHEGVGAPINEENLRRSVVEQLVSEELMYQAARDEGLTVSDEELRSQVEFLEARRGGEEKLDAYIQSLGLNREQFRDHMRHKILVSRFVESLLSEDAVTDAEIEEYYKKTPEPFLRPGRVEVRFIQTAGKEKAMEIWEEIETGGFESVAEKYSGGKDEEVVVSGYGWTQPGLFGENIASALDELEEGQSGGPYQGKGAWYLLKVRNREYERPATYEEAAPRIRRQLTDRRRQGAVAHWLAEKRPEANVVIN